MDILEMRVAMSLKELQREIWELMESKGWHETDSGPLANHMLIVSEIAEATESVRHGEPDEWIDDKGKPQGEAVELADAVHRILDYFATKGWDLEAVLRRKLEFNKTRPYRHGGLKY